MIRSTSHDVRYRTAFSNGSREAIAEVPAEKGGRGDGFGPHELLEAAFATMTAQMYADRQGIALSRACCEVKLDRSVPGAPSLSYELALKGPITPEQDRQVREAVNNCPVARTLAGSFTFKPI